MLPWRGLRMFGIFIYPQKMTSLKMLAFSLFGIFLTLKKPFAVFLFRNSIA
jgi:hypothetical protein